MLWLCVDVLVGWDCVPTPLLCLCPPPLPPHTHPLGLSPCAVHPVTYPVWPGTQQPFLVLLFRRSHTQPGLRVHRCEALFARAHRYLGRVVVVLGLLNCGWGITYLDIEHRARGPAFVVYCLWVTVLAVSTLWCSVRKRKRNS